MSELINVPNIQINNRFNSKTFNKDENANNESKSEKYSRKFSNNDKKMWDKSMNMSAYEKMNNASKVDVIPFSTDLHLINNAKLFYFGRNQNKNYIDARKDMKNNEEKFDYIHFNLNIFDYLCLGRFRQKNKNYLLFRKGILMYKEKLDIINIFNSILFSEKFGEIEKNKDEIG